MNKIFKKLSMIVSVVFAALTICGCDDSDSVRGEDGMDVVDELFQRIKASYTGKYISADNTAKQMRFSIDDQANVVVKSFPLDMILAKVYPYEYTSITEIREHGDLVSPITGFNVNSSLTLLDFAASNRDKGVVSFKYVKDGEEHSGWAQITVIGAYNIYGSTLTARFTVNDLVIDNNDLQNLTPIDYYVDSAEKVEE